MEVTAINSRWRKSSYSGNGGNCVEVGTDQAVLVRDTKDRQGPVLRVPADKWQELLTKVKSL